MFWDLSFFEWSLYLRRFNINLKRIEAIDESHWARFRIQWADFRNAHFKKEVGQFEPQDLVTLSFDKEVTQVDRPIQEVEAESIERFKKAKGQLGSKIKKDVSD